MFYRETSSADGTLVGGAGGDARRFRKADLRWDTGCWLGWSDCTDEHIIGASMGVRMTQSVRRKVPPANFIAEVVREMRGVPWAPEIGAPRGRPKRLAAPAATPGPVGPPAAEETSVGQPTAQQDAAPRPAGSSGDGAAASEEKLRREPARTASSRRERLSRQRRQRRRRQTQWKWMTDADVGE